MRNPSISKHAKAFRMTAATAVLWGLGLVSAGAATLGGQQVRSAAGEPLRAVILLSDVAPEEADGLTVKLAGAEAFRQAGIRYRPALAQMNVSLSKNETGRYVVHVDSTEPVDASYLDLLLVLEWRTGRQSAVYTLANTPWRSNPTPQAVVPAAVAQPSSSHATVPAAAARSTQAAATQTVEDGARVVRRGDTLSSVAQQWVDDVGAAGDMSVAQMITALFEANRAAFIDNDPNRLREGATLKRPDDAQVKAVAPAQARRFVASSRARFDAYRARLAESAATQSTPAEGGRSAQGKIEAGQASQAAAPVTQDALKLSRPKSSQGRHAAGVDAGDVEEARIARDKADADAQGRVKDLQKNVADLQKLLAMKNQAVAKLEQQNVTASGVTAQDQPIERGVTGAGAATTKAASTAGEKTVMPASSAGAAVVSGASHVAAAAADAASATAAAVDPVVVPAAASSGDAADALLPLATASSVEAAASAPVAAAAAAKPSVIPEIDWRALRDHPYALPAAAAGVLVALSGLVLLLTRRRKSTPPVGQDGPYDHGDDDGHALAVEEPPEASREADPLPAAGVAATVGAEATALYEANRGEDEASSARSVVEEAPVVEVHNLNASELQAVHEEGDMTDWSSQTADAVPTLNVSELWAVHAEGDVANGAVNTADVEPVLNASELQAVHEEGDVADDAVVTDETTPAPEFPLEPTLKPAAEAVLSPAATSPDTGVSSIIGDLTLDLPGQSEHVGTLPTATPPSGVGALGSVHYKMLPETGASHEPESELDVEPSDADFEVPHIDAPHKATYADVAHEAPSLKPLAFDLSGFNLDLKGEASGLSLDLGGASGVAAETSPSASASPVTQTSAPVPETAASAGHSEASAVVPAVQAQSAFAEKAAEPLQSPTDVYRVMDTADAGDDSQEAIYTKLELAAAYQAIGDNEGARELLEEVLQSGDADAQSEARARLAALGK